MTKGKPQPRGSKKGSSVPTPAWSRYLRNTIVYLLAFYGAHSIVAQILPAYNNFVRTQLSRTVQGISSGAENVEKTFSPLPTVTIKSPGDLKKSAYDNLKVGVPGFDCDVIIDRAGYALGYSEKYEQPLWVTYLLTPEEVKSKKAKRSGDFRSDPAIPYGSAELADYKGSHYDRGHLAPAADMSFSLQAMSESFYMSNMSPQLPEFNRGAWKDLEEKVREFAANSNGIYVVSGPIFDSGKTITIGANKVGVPDKYYKVLLDVNSLSPKAIGFILPHRELTRPLQDYAVTVDAVEQITQLNFFDQLDPDDEKKLERHCDYQAWERMIPQKKLNKRKSKRSKK